MQNINVQKQIKNLREKSRFHFQNIGKTIKTVLFYLMVDLGRFFESGL